MISTYLGADIEEIFCYDVDHDALTVLVNDHGQRRCLTCGRHAICTDGRVSLQDLAQVVIHNGVARRPDRRPLAEVYAAWEASCPTP